MKMVILGASAPKCDIKPSNPTSASQVGTMTGSVAGGKQGPRGSTAAAAHRPQYQGLLQAPRIPGIFDHQLIKTSYDDTVATAKKVGDVRSGSYGESPVNNQGGISIAGSSKQGGGLGLLSDGFGKPPKTSQPQQHRSGNGPYRYHYQQFNSQSATNFGGIGGQKSGLRPGQKSIKQQRDLAQLRFYQTLTNQPHLISQAQSSQDQQAFSSTVGNNQVKMLSNMRMGQQPGTAMNKMNQLRDNSKQQEAYGKTEGRQDLKSGQATLRPSHLSNFTGQPTGQIASQNVQQRAQTTQGANNGGVRRRQVGQTASAIVVEQTADRGLSGLNIDTAVPMSAQTNQKDAKTSGPTTENAVTPGVRAVTASKIEQGIVVPQATNQGASNLQEIQDYNVTGDDPYDQRRSSQVGSSKGEKIQKGKANGQRSSQGLMNAIHGAIPVGSQRKVGYNELSNIQKSNTTIKQNDSHRESQNNFLARSGQAMMKDQGNSYSPQRYSNTGFRSDGRKSSPSKKSKSNMGIQIGKIEKKNQHMLQERTRGNKENGGADDEVQRGMERFSSQGQEELVQAYQLPTVYTNNDSKSGYQSQHNAKRRNYTSYGGPRSSAAAGVAARNHEYMRQSAASTYHTGGNAGPASTLSGHPQIPNERNVAAFTNTAYPGQGPNSKSKGNLSNLLVKTCSFQPREANTQRREQIKADYTLPPRGGTQGGLPRIGRRTAGYGQVSVAAGGINADFQGSITRAGNSRADPGESVPENMNSAQTNVEPETSLLPMAKELSGVENLNSTNMDKKSTGGNSQSRHTHQGPGHCQRFMRRGNNPVPASYEEQEPAPAGAMIPYFGGPDSIQENQQALTSEPGPISGKAIAKQGGRQMIYGNLKLGNFDEEISGINLSKLFSVYGPQSAADGLRRKKKSKPEHQGTGIDGSPNRSPDNQIKQDLNGLHIQGDYKAAIGQTHLKQSQPSAGDHSSTDRERVAGYQSRQRDHQRYYSDTNQELEDESSEEESEEDEEPLIIQLMESMFSRKKTVEETEQLISEISVEEIRKEFRKLAILEKCKVADLERAKIFNQRMQECEKLNELIKKENEDISASVFDKPDLTTRENPFYQALRAQKDERDRYKQMLQLAIMGSSEEENMQDHQTTEPKSLAIESNRDGQDAGNDIFKHTFVDILEDDKSKAPVEQVQNTDQSQAQDKQRKDIFFFYNFSFDLPTEYYKQLGDFSVIKRPQAQKIKEFMTSQWPVLKGKKVQYKMAYDQVKDVFNVVLLGKDCPLSKCCKMTVYFQFTKDIGGKVICMENLCALNPLDHFFIELDLVKTLFYDFSNNVQNSQYQGSELAESQNVTRPLINREVLTKKEYKRLKPTFKKVISQEISKMISKGTHLNLSIRDVIQGQDLEEKVQHHVTKGKAGMMGKIQNAPPKLTQSKLMKLLYDGSSQGTASQYSQMGSESQQYQSDAGLRQPMGSFQWNQGNEDLGFALNPQMYEQMMLQNPGFNQNIAGFTGLNEPYMPQMNMDQMDEMMLNNQQDQQQNNVLFSHTALEEASPTTDNQKLNRENLEEMKLDDLDPSSRGYNDEIGDGIGTNQTVAHQKTTGTFNPTPQLVVKSNLTSVKDQNADRAQKQAQKDEKEKDKSQENEQMTPFEDVDGLSPQVDKIEVTPGQEQQEQIQQIEQTPEIKEE